MMTGYARSIRPYCCYEWGMIGADMKGGVAESLSCAPVGCVGDEPLVAIPEPYEAAVKGMSVSDEVAMAGDPAGSQVQSGESGILPNQVSFPRERPLKLIQAFVCPQQGSYIPVQAQQGLGVQQEKA